MVVWLLIMSIWVGGLTYLYFRIFFALRQDNPHPKHEDFEPVIVDDEYSFKVEEREEAERD